MFRFPIVIGFVGLVAGLIASPSHADPKPTGDARSLGRIAIVPFLDISGEQQEARAQYRETALSEVMERCKKYEIAFVPPADTAAAMDELKMSAADQEDRTKARFKELADRLKVRYVLTGVIYDAKSELRQNTGFEPPKAGQAKVQIKVFDASSGRYAEELEATATSTARGGLLHRANKLRVKAVRDATKKAMAPFLKPFPKLHDEAPESSDKTP